MTPTSDASAYIWPESLRLPPRPPKVVYLDLLHWIALAKANSGHRQGAQFARHLDACLAAVAASKAVFPISDAIYMEVAKIGQFRQRRDLRSVIERVSAFRVVTSRVVIAQHEVEALLNRKVGPSPTPINAMDYLDWGVMRAFGMVGSLRVRAKDTGEDVTAEARMRHPDGPEAFDMIVMKGELELNRKVLEGPTAEEEPELRGDGWDPRAAFAVAERRAAQEVEQAERLNKDPAWRGERLRDVIAAREVLIEINRMLYEGLSARGSSLDQLMDEADVIGSRRAFDSMPSFDVSVSMKAAYHRDPEHTWKPNDIHDIDALASTVPYCDIVATDKEAASHLGRTGVADRLGTIVVTSLDRLVDLL